MSKKKDKIRDFSLFNLDLFVSDRITFNQNCEWLLINVEIRP
jgi:hypothetical protein